MFTVKVIDPDGDEFVMQAESYSLKREVVEGRPDFIRFFTYDTKHQSSDYSGLWAGLRVPGLVLYGADYSIIYVMNENGATVDKIALGAVPADYWGAQGSDEPESPKMAEAA